MNAQILRQDPKLNISRTSPSPSGSAPLLEVSHVTCAYTQHPAVSDISFSVNQGEILCILGPSGCGKTTILRAIAGFQNITAGRITLNGRIVSSPTIHLPAEKRKVGMVFQDYALFPHLCVADNIGFGLKQREKNSRKAQIQLMMELVGLGGLERRYPHELSGGQQQRVALARALAPNPVMVLMDEPFSNLDPDMTVKMRKELYHLLRQTKTTSILVTHDHDEAFAMADNVAVLHEGRLVQCDTPEIIYHLPSCPFVAEFVGQADFIPGNIQNGQVETELGPFTNQERYQGSANVLVMIRPDDLQITHVGTGNARIESRQFRGSENLYAIRLASGRLVHCSAPSTEIYDVDALVGLAIVATHTVLFEHTS